MFYAAAARTVYSPLDSIPRSRRSPDRLNILVLGDWGRNGSPRQLKVARAMEREAIQRPPDFVIATGDNFYDNGVKDVSDPQWQSSFEQVYTAASLRVPWFAVLGNHDYNLNPDAQVAYTTTGGRWMMPARYYDTSFILGADSILFVFIDTDPIEKQFLGRPYDSLRYRPGDADKQLNWLREVLSSSKAKWKIVTGHIPPHTGGARRHSSRTRKMRRILAPIFAESGADLYLSGHEHHLEYLKPPGSTHYIISGAGSETRHVGWLKRYRRFAARTTGFVSLSVDPHNLIIRFLNGEGELLYEHRIIK